MDVSAAAPAITAQAVNAQTQLSRSSNASKIGVLRDTEPDILNRHKSVGFEERRKNWMDSVRGFQSFVSGAIKGMLVYM
jgi:hypothetical protein